MDILIIVVICLVILVCLWAWFCFMKESLKDLKHIILLLKARMACKSIHSEQSVSDFHLGSLSDDELKEFLKDK